MLRKDFNASDVAPLVGAWIEIVTTLPMFEQQIVAPLVGAWIEIPRCRKASFTVFVAPLVGAWIEMSPAARGPARRSRRAPRGRVD